MTGISLVTNWLFWQKVNVSIVYHVMSINDNLFNTYIMIAIFDKISTFFFRCINKKLLIIYWQIVSYILLSYETKYYHLSLLLFNVVIDKLFLNTWTTNLNLVLNSLCTIVFDTWNTKILSHSWFIVWPEQKLRTIIHTKKWLVPSQFVGTQAYASSNQE